jgi:hypothetical protein
MSELSSRLASVPDKCSGCGVQCDLSMDLARAMAMKRAAEHAGGSLVGEAGERFDAMVEAMVPEEIADEAKDVIRKTVGEDIGEMDKTIEGIQDEIKANALSCNGVLKMRASREGVTYTVSVCTSPRIYIRGGAPTQAPTQIRADSEK